MAHRSLGKPEDLLFITVCTSDSCYLWLAGSLMFLHFLRSLKSVAQMWYRHEIINCCGCFSFTQIQTLTLHKLVQSKQTRLEELLKLCLSYFFLKCGLAKSILISFKKTMPVAKSFSTLMTISQIWLGNSCYFQLNREFYRRFFVKIDEIFWS